MLIFLKDRKKISYELYFYFSAKKDKDPNSRTGIHEQCIGEYSGVTRTLYLERCGKGYWRFFTISPINFTTMFQIQSTSDTDVFFDTLFMNTRS